jgi:hypothetical protein
MPALTPRNLAIGAGAVVAAAYIFPRTVGKVAPEYATNNSNVFFSTKADQQKHIRDTRCKERGRQIRRTGRHHHTFARRCYSPRYVSDAVPCYAIVCDAHECLLIDFSSGNSDSVVSNQDKMKGLGTKEFANNQSIQKADPKESKFLEAHTGDPKGK